MTKCGAWLLLKLCLGLCALCRCIRYVNVCVCMWMSRLDGVLGSGDAAGLCWWLQETNHPCLCFPRPVVFVMTYPDRPTAAPAKPLCNTQWKTGPHQQHANDWGRGRMGGETVRIGSKLKKKTSKRKGVASV